jgi:hypothetical protein
LWGEQPAPPGAAAGAGDGDGAAAGGGVPAGVGSDVGRATTPIPGAEVDGERLGRLTGVGSTIGEEVGAADGGPERVTTGGVEAGGAALAPAVGPVDGTTVPGPGAPDGGPAVGTDAIWVG